MNWTARDEQRHKELQKQLDALDARREAARQRLYEVLNSLYDRDLGMTSVDLAIEHADRLIDALAPFDSGIRSASESA